MRSLSCTGRTSPVFKVTSACVLPDAVTNSTSKPSGSYTCTTAPRSPLRRPCSGRFRSSTTVSRTLYIMSFLLGTRSRTVARPHRKERSRQSILPPTSLKGLLGYHEFRTSAHTDCPSRVLHCLKPLDHGDLHRDVASWHSCNPAWRK